MHDSDSDPRHAIEAAIQRALQTHGYFSNEDGRKCKEDKIDLQLALVKELGADSCERELPAMFCAPGIQPTAPPSHLGRAKDVCAKRGKSRRLDILMRFNGSLIAIELKLRRVTKWSGHYESGDSLYPREPVDTYGYEFLKDLHRLERLTSVKSKHGKVIPDRRFAVFLSNDPYEFEGQVPHDNLALYARQLKPGHLAQFSHTSRRTGRPTSENTLWKDYPPFHLCSGYAINWIELDDDVSRFHPSATSKNQSYPSSRLLIVEAIPQ